MMLPVITILAASERVAEKAAHMAQTDPHGTTLTLVSVSVVFSALIILFIAYSISGKIFTRKNAKTPAVVSDDSAATNAAEEEEIAAAIAVALYEEELAAASLYRSGEGIHDYESGIITIKR